MCPNILSLIYVLYVLHISCAARVIVKDTGTNYVPAQLNVDNPYKKLPQGWLFPLPTFRMKDCGQQPSTTKYSQSALMVGIRQMLECRPSLVLFGKQAFIRKYHLVEVDKNARLVLGLPFLLTTAGNNRANEPESTPAVSFWKTKGMASKLLLTKKIIAAIQRVEEPAPTYALGLLFQSAIHEKITDS
ncbi:hypothetical protein F4604DRAFT_1673532 [Suillus subluteus]|nr:hypothetical protein F4604DRAFT_1673532 [Suillus subluteus]